jgi:hypothetical protein
MLLKEGNNHSQTNTANELYSQIGQQGLDTNVQERMLLSLMHFKDKEVKTSLTRATSDKRNFHCKKLI